MDRFQLPDYLGWGKLPDHIVVVHVISQRVVAVMHAYVEPAMEESKEYLMLDMLAVDVEFQGRGIGPAMILIADNLAHHLSIKELRLEALNLRLVEYYRQFGYERYGDPIQYYDPWEGEVFPMRKSLT